MVEEEEEPRGEIERCFRLWQVFGDASTYLLSRYFATVGDASAFSYELLDYQILERHPSQKMVM